MLMQWWFEHKRKEFFEKKAKIACIAFQRELNGDVNGAKEILETLDYLQHEADRIAKHYISGGNALQKGAAWRIYGFSRDLSKLEASLKSSWRQFVEGIFSVGLFVFLVKRFWFVLYAVPSGSAEPNLLIGDRICGVKYAYLFKKPKRYDLVIFDQVNFVYSQNPLARMYQKYIGFGLGPLPAGPDMWTKRVVGLPGDRVAMQINDAGFGEVFVNGAKLEEPHRNPYPLILLKRKQGFLPAHSAFFKWPFVGPFLASFLQMREKKLTPYTFDPTKPYNKQPFYNFDEKDVVLNPYTGKPYIFPPETADPRRDAKAEFVVAANEIFVLGDNRWNSYDGRDWGCVPLSTVRGRASFIYFSVDGTEDWWILEFIKGPLDFICRKMRWSRCFKFLKHGASLLVAK